LPTVAKLREARVRSALAPLKVKKIRLFLRRFKKSTNRLDLQLYLKMRLVSLKSLALSLAAAACASAARNPKRGFVGDGCTGAACADFDLLSSAGWYYAYNPGDPFSSSSPSTIHQEFVPMHWCISGLANATIPAGTNATFLLGFNEPNNLHNCNKPPKDIAEAWATVLKLWAPTSILVSPATAGEGRPWLDAFFGNCTAMYGPKGCQVSHIAVHDYSCDAATTMAYLKAVHDRYNKPVWLTEFSCGDGAQKQPTSKHLAYMKEVFPLLDKADYVYRYAWMSANDKSGLRGLVSGSSGSQTLTKVGELFNSI